MATDPKTSPPLRWIHANSDAPDEVREVLRQNVPQRGDRARIARLEQRLLPLLGGPPTLTGGDLPAPGLAGGALGGSTSVAPSGAASLAGVLGAASASKLVVAVALGGALGAGTYHVAQPPEPVRGALTQSLATPLAAAATAAAQQTRVPPTPPPQAVPATPAPAGRAPTQVRLPAPSVPATLPPPSQLRAEAALLSRARTHARIDPAQALVALVEHAQRFPNGALREERELFMIRLLAEGGRLDSAREKLRHLELTSPNSPYRDAARAHIEHAESASDRQLPSERHPPSDIPKHD